MAASSMDPFLRGNTGRNTRGLLRLIILCIIAAAAVSSRLFSVISKFAHASDIPVRLMLINVLIALNAGFESIIHECPYSPEITAP